MIPESWSYHNGYEEGGIESLSLCLFHQIPHLTGSESVFSLVFFLQLKYQSFLVAFYFPPQIQLQMGHSFPNLIPACLNSISMFLPRHMSLLPLLVSDEFLGWMKIQGYYCKLLTKNSRSEKTSGKHEMRVQYGNMAHCSQIKDNSFCKAVLRTLLQETTALSVMGFSYCFAFKRNEVLTLVLDRTRFYFQILFIKNKLWSQIGKRRYVNKQ